MNRILSIALLAGGVALFSYGIYVASSIGPDSFRLLAGPPTGKSLLLLFGGIVAAAGGLGGLLRESESVHPNSHPNP